MHADASQYNLVHMFDSVKRVTITAYVFPLEQFGGFGIPFPAPPPERSAWVCLPLRPLNSAWRCRRSGREANRRLPKKNDP